MSFRTYFSRQAHKPTGWFGRWVMSYLFDIGNTRLNKLVLQTLAPKAGDRILEIGCGTGKLLDSMVKGCSKCDAEGIDFSDTMVSIARRKNRKHIATGKVVIHKGNVDEMPLREETYTKVYSINTIYFWPHPRDTSKKIAHLIKPRGKFALGFEDIAQLEQRRLDRSVFRFYSTSDVEIILIEAGFTGGVTTRSIRVGSSVFHCTVAPT